MTTHKTHDLTPVSYVLAHRQTGEIEAAGTCDARAFEYLYVAAHQVKVIGQGTSVSHYHTSQGLQAYTPGQRQAKATPQLHCAWDNHRMCWVDVRSLEELRAERWAQIKAARTVAIQSPIDTPFGRFDACPASQAALAAAVAVAPVEWTTADNTTVTLDGPGLKEVLRLIGRRTQACHATTRRLRACVEKAATVQELAAVNGEVG